MNTEELPVIFKDRLTQAFKRSSFRSHRALSTASGLGETRVHRMINGQFDNSKDGPGLFNIVRLCEQLSITPDYLVGQTGWNNPSSPMDTSGAAMMEAYAGLSETPTTKEFARRYVRGGARLEAFHDLRDFFDLYGPPDRVNKNINVLRVGPKSVAGQRVGGSNPAILQTCYDNASPALRNKIFSGQVKAFDGGYVCEPDSIDEMYETVPMHIKIDYLRTSMRVSDASGSEYLILFAEVIPQ